MSQLKAQRVLKSRALKRRNYSRYNDPKEVMRVEIQGRCRAKEHEFPGEPPPALTSVGPAGDQTRRKERQYPGLRNSAGHGWGPGCHSEFHPPRNLVQQLFMKPQLTSDASPKNLGASAPAILRMIETD